MTTGRGETTRRALLGGMLGAVASAGLGGRQALAGDGTGGEPPTPVATPMIEPVAEPAVDPVDQIVAGLSSDEKVAQLFMFVADGTSMTPSYAADLARQKPGGVILLGYNFGAAAAVGPFVEAIHASNPDLPPLVALDQEGGLVTRLPNDPTSGAVALGQLPDRVVRSEAHQRADYVRSFGFDINFAPVADVSYGPESAMAGRAFGSDPETVAAKVTAVVNGSKEAGLAGAAKHFPGLGRTTLDSHFALPEVDLSFADWLATDALPFEAAIEAGVEMVMLGHLRYSNWDEAPTSISAVAVDVLRNDLGFDGAIVTDDLGMGALAGINPYDALNAAVDAGIDLFLYASPPVPPDSLLGHLQWRVANGEVPEERIDASLRRLLRLKLGLR